MVTGEIAQNALRLDFDLKRILDLLLENEKAVNDERDIGAKALDYFYEQFTMNRSNFNELRQTKNAHMGTDILENRKVFGGTYWKSDEQFVYILPSVFRQWMKDGGFEDSKIILKDWKLKGLLDAEEDRFTRKRKIHDDSTAVTVYCIRLNPGQAASTEQ